jgi:RNA-directed DNA polymerase
LKARNAIYNELWHNIDWHRVNEYVYNIQYAMVVAYRNGNMKETYRLQKKLIMSFEGRALAVRKVTSNEGGRTPGIDNITWNNPYLKYNAIIELRKILLTKFTEYKAHRIKRVWIPKPSSTTLRPLGIPTIRDRALQMLVLLSLDPIIEEVSDLHSYGSRKYRGAHDAILRKRHILDKKTSPMWIWDVDLEKCFDTISHEFIETKLKEFLCPFARKYVCKWLKAEIIENGNVIKPICGIPQGGVISPILCNITLNGLEHVIRQGVTSHKSTKGKLLTGVWITRYVDDFIVTSRSKEFLETNIIPKVKEFLHERNLKISESKSKIIHLKESSFEFLGWNISLNKRLLSKNQHSEKKTVLLIKPTTSSIKRIKLKLNRVYKTQQQSFLYLIRKLNPILRVWSNYYRISYHSQREFSKLNNYVFGMTLQWLKRKHPTKSMKWIYKKYIFKDNKNSRSWRFSLSNNNTILVDITLINILKLKRLKSGVNPYFNENYYEKYPRIIVSENFREQIYKKYKFKCVACNKSLYGDEQIDLHHLNPKKSGGKYSLENIVPLHQTCHVGITHARKQWFKFKPKSK